MNTVLSNILKVLFILFFLATPVHAQVGMPTFTFAVSDDDTTIYNPTTIGFPGASVVTQDGAGALVTITGGGADGVGYDEILEEAAGLTKRAQLNFIGASITCVDNAGSTRTDCTLSPGAEVNDLEATITGIADTEIFVGNGADSGVYAALSNDCSLSNTGVITCDHDALLNFLATEHVNWAAAGPAGTVHVDNYIEGHGDGTDCNAGEYPLGIDAVGAVKSCTDATTEINSVVNGLGGTGLTCAAQSCDVDLGTDIATTESASPTGTDTNVVTGTKGSTGEIASWDANGDVIDSNLIVSTLTDENVCEYEATGTFLICATPKDGSGTCASGAICTGDHTHPTTQVDDTSGTNTGDNDEVGTLTTGDMCTNDGSLVQCTVNTEAEFETAMDGIDFVTVTADDITSANLATLVNGETGTGDPVFHTSPTMVTPVLGVATATSINKVAITAPASASTLTIADGKTLTATNTVDLDSFTDEYVCNYEATGTKINCDIPIDASGACAASSICGGGHTHAASTFFAWQLAPQSAKLPASNPMGIDAGNLQWRGLFDDTTDECARWQGVLTPYGGGGLDIDITYSLETTSTSDVVELEVYVMCGKSNADMDTDSFDTV